MQAILRKIPPGVPRGAARLVYWHLRLHGPCVDRRLELALHKLFGTEPSTVRGARLRLQRLGIVRPVCRTRNGRKWGIAEKDS